MYYQSDEIENNLICKICSSKFQDPRLVPCGETYCHECIKSSAKNGSFSCISCNSNHLVASESEFPRNNVIATLIKTAPKEIYRGKSYKQLTKWLKRMESDLSDFEILINKYFIGSYSFLNILII